jgi:hypothetical protein
VTAPLALLVLVLAFRFTYRRGPRAGYVLIAASLLWLALDKSMEGRTLIHLDEDHAVLLSAASADRSTRNPVFTRNLTAP